MSYKFANSESTLVEDTATGYKFDSNSWRWATYLEWLAFGGGTLPYRTKEELQAEVKLEIKTLALSRRYGGILINTYWLQSDPDSRIEYLVLKDLARDLFAAGGLLDDPVIVDGDQVELETMGGVFIPITLRRVKLLTEALQVLDRRLRRVAKYHIAQMLLAADPLQYDYSTGWPPSYSG